MAGSPLPTTSAPRRSKGRTLLAVLFAITSALALHQAATEDTSLLRGWQLINGILAALTALGLWRVARLTWLAVLSWTASTASMVALLGVLLNLPADTRGGLIAGALAIVAMGTACAWYARR